MKKIALIIFSLVIWGQTHAGAATLNLDPVHTGVFFQVKHVYSTVRGQFDDFSADIIFDPDNLEKSKMNFVVKVDSINTQNGKRDTHLRSDAFFLSNKYPTITFTSSRIIHAYKNQYIVEGKMTIKDVSRQMAMVMVYWGQKENPLKPAEMVAGFDIDFSLDRLDFHVGDGKFYNMGAVGKDIDILVSIEAGKNK
jgi:polyisoprenoid-binding protein YceI